MSQVGRSETSCRTICKIYLLRISVSFVQIWEDNDIAYVQGCQVYFGVQTEEFVSGKRKQEKVCRLNLCVMGVKNINEGTRRDMVLFLTW